MWAGRYLQSHNLHCMEIREKEIGRVLSDAAPPEEAEPLYNIFVDQLRRQLGNNKVATGLFRAMMDVELINDGPVTIMLESKG